MDQYAYVLADRIAGGVIVTEPGEIDGILSKGKVPIIAPAQWMRSADVFPHSWEVTSDSIAAFVAGALGAARLALIKPALSNDPVDRYFGSDAASRNALSDCELGTARRAVGFGSANRPLPPHPRSSRAGAFARKMVHESVWGHRAT